jgi:pilus assembly protein CpaF
VFVRREGRLVRGGGLPPRRERFESVGLDLARLLNEEH